MSIVRIKLKAYDHRILDKAAEKIVETIKRSGGEISGPVPLPTEIEKFTVIKATHKYKDSREQFERRTHKRIIDIKNFRKLKRSLETGIRINKPYIRFDVGNHPRQKGKTLAYYICDNIICVVKKKNDNSQLGNFSGAAQCTYIVNQIIEDELKSLD